MKHRRSISPGQIVLVAFLFFITLTMLVPLLNILAKSLSSPEVSPLMGGLTVLPQDIDLINYKIVLSHPVLVPALINSIIITLVGTLINIALTTTAAYALTRPNLTLKRPLMVFLIIMMLFDPGMVPEYVVIQQLGLMGSKWSVILVTAVNVYYLVIMMRYFEKVPQSLVEAAVLDGANHIQMLTKIFYPLSKAGIATITMFYAVVRWNEYFRASIYLTKKSTDTVLQVILRQFVVLGDTVSIIGQQNVYDYNTMARVDYGALKGATIIVAIVPILILYPFVLKFYAKDVMAGGIKE
ncbi:carbohydrate ABC transporter permease [uncultured Sphaerochaeta sp.]|uniref:carbohydrate ABC transporter permease n=1 Tax=uncultured Sphaerochaeta sp. TaxID=886478 RepID=UPI002A0A300E|nr:carbohydrate ABC transporter permease [uncultured Sphaerochaeta sp.]